MQFRAEVDKDFNLLALSVQFVAGSSVDSRRVFCKRNVRTACLFHIGSTGNQLLNVESGNCDRQQTNRSEHRETSAYVVRNDKCLVSFFVGSHTCSTFLGVCHGNDDFLGGFFAALVFTLLFQQTESKSGFGSRSRFGDIDNTEFLVFQIFGQFIQIVFADVMSSIDHDRSSFLVLQPCETVRQRFDYGTCAQIAATDTCYDHYFAVVS